MDIKDYIQNNKEWIFSGIGLYLIIFFNNIVGFIKNVFYKNKKDADFIEISINNKIKNESISIYNPRAEFDDYMSFLINQSKKNITLVSITFGFVSYPKLEKLIEDSSIIFDFYILDPKSKNFKNRQKDLSKNNENNYLSSSDTDNLLKLKDKFPDRINIFKYDSYPFWHYALIDDKKIFLSYHPIDNNDSLGYKTTNVFQADKNSSSEVFEIFKSHINIIKMESKKYE